MNKGVCVSISLDPQNFAVERCKLQSVNKWHDDKKDTTMLSLRENPRRIIRQCSLLNCIIVPNCANVFHFAWEACWKA